MATLIFLSLALTLLPSAWFYTTRPANIAPVVHAATNGPHVTVLTLNLAKVTDIDQITRELKPADILLFQEVVRDDESRPSVAEKIAGKLGMHVQFASPDRGSTASGIAMRSSMSPPWAFSSIKIHPANGRGCSSAASQISPFPSWRKSRTLKPESANSCM